MTLALKNVLKLYQTIDNITSTTITALMDINIEIQEGTTNLIIGPSGAGKTTLLEIMSTFNEPTTGFIELDSINPFNLSRKNLQVFRKEKIGFLQQRIQNCFIPNITFKKNIEFLESITDSKNLLEVINEYLEELGLDKRILDVPMKFLSGGEQQRSALILILLRNPTILLLDEPTSYLDQKTKGLVVQLLKKLQSQGKTIIIATHDYSFVNLSDNILYIEDGKIRKKQSFSDIVPELFENIQIDGNFDEKSRELEIPESIFQHLPLNIIIHIKKENNKTILQPITAEDFEKKDLESWIYLKSNRIVVPTTISKSWTVKNRFLWTIKENYVEIDIV